MWYVFNKIAREGESQQKGAWFLGGGGGGLTSNSIGVNNFLGRALIHLSIQGKEQVFLHSLLLFCLLCRLMENARLLGQKRQEAEKNLSQAKKDNQATTMDYRSMEKDINTSRPKLMKLQKQKEEYTRCNVYKVATLAAPLHLLALPVHSVNGKAIMIVWTFSWFYLNQNIYEPDTCDPVFFILAMNSVLRMRGPFMFVHCVHVFYSVSCALYHESQMTRLNTWLAMLANLTVNVCKRKCLIDQKICGLKPQTPSFLPKLQWNKWPIALHALLSTSLCSE